MGTLKIRQRVLMPNLESVATDATARAAAATAQSGVNATKDVVAGETQIGTFLAAPMYRKVLTLAAGPNASTVSVAHGITAPTAILRCVIQAVASGVHLCFDSGGLEADTLAHGIIVAIDGTNVSLTSGAGGDYHLYAGHIILEYTK